MTQNFCKFRRILKDASSIFGVLWLLFSTWGGVCYAFDMLSKMGAWMAGAIFIFYVIVSVYIVFKVLKRN